MRVFRDEVGKPALGSPFYGQVSSFEAGRIYVQEQQVMLELVRGYK